MRKGIWQHRIGRQFMECASRFTRRKGIGYRSSYREGPSWNPEGATRQESKMGTHPGLLTQREQTRLVNVHFKCRDSRRSMRWAEAFQWRMR